MWRLKSFESRMNIYLRLFVFVLNLWCCKSVLIVFKLRMSVLLIVDV